MACVRPKANKINEIYGNITESMIRQCLQLCPFCARSNDNIRKKDKGPGIPIKSFGFRSRIQVDLIDYQCDPRFNHNNVEMKWLLVIKDHFTKFTWLRPLRKKKLNW